MDEKTILINKRLMTQKVVVLQSFIIALYYSILYACLNSVFLISKDATFLSKSLNLFYLLATSLVLFFIITFLSLLFFSHFINRFHSEKNSELMSWAIGLFVLLLMLYVNRDITSFYPFTFCSFKKSVVIMGKSFCFSVTSFVLSQWLKKFSSLYVKILKFLPLLLFEYLVFIWLKKFALIGNIILYSSFSILIAMTFYGYYFLFIRGKEYAINLALFTLIFCFAFIGSFLNEGTEPSEITQVPRNHKKIILIVMDSLRKDVLSCYGGSRIQTCHMDRFAKESIFFKNAHAAAPWTVPSIVSIMTGLDPSVHMTTTINSRIPQNLNTLAEILGQKGYLTAAIGKNPTLVPIIGRGFKDFYFFPSDVKKINRKIEAIFLRHIIPEKLIDDVNTAILTNIACKWLHKNARRDFFLYIHYFDPHHPYEPPVRYLPPQTMPPGRIGLSFSDSNFDIRKGIKNLNLDERDWIKMLYEGEVKYLDDNIGRLVDSLKYYDIYQDAFIIITSDHGEEFWEHGSISHGHTYYDELVRVPLFVKIPQQKVNRIVSELVTTTGLFSTVLDFCNVPYPDRPPSESSLSQLLFNNSYVSLPHCLHFSANEYFDEREAVRIGDWKYIFNLVTGKEELYNLTKDPQEKLSLDEKYPQQLSVMRKELELQNQQFNDLKNYYKLSKSEEVEQDQFTIEQLKSLGYLK